MSDRWLAPCGLAIGIKKWQTAPLHNLAFGPTNHVVETRARRTSGLAEGATAGSTTSLEGFRIEVRDFYSGLINYNQKVTGNLQNSLALTGGLLVRF
jgi:hypothetical protein